MERLSREQDIEVRVNPHDRSLTREELLEGLSWADGAVTQLVDKIDAEMLKACLHLKVIAQVYFFSIRLSKSLSLVCCWL